MVWDDGKRTDGVTQNAGFLPLRNVRFLVPRRRFAPD